MKKLLIFILTATLLSACAVVRPNGSDELFQYSVKDGQAVITEYIGRKKQVTIPAQFRGYPVTEIADEVFKDKIYVTEVSFEGQNLRRIGKQAFLGTSISRITFPESLQTLGDEAFCQSERIRFVTFSGVPESIGAGAFFRCTELSEVFFPAESAGACSIGEFAFGGCSALTQLTIPATVVADNAFIACKNITSVNAPNLERVGAAAFSDCTALVSADMPKLKSVGESGFESCGSLTQLNSAPLESVGAYAFHQCLALAQAAFANGVEIYKSSVKNSGIVADCIDDDDATRVIDGRTYTRTFYDEFDDLSQWSKCPNYEMKDSIWRDENSHTDNGQLVIDITPGPQEFKNKYYAGGVWTADTFSQKYGYFEIRCRLTSEPGFWSAFWLMPTEGASMANENDDGTANDGAEIDIYESPYASAEKISSAVHWDGYGANHKSILAGEYMKHGLYFGYHTFALKWTQAEYVFFVDGQEFGRVTDPALISHVKEHMLISAEVGTWAGMLAESSLPFVGIYVDSVKVYTEEQ